jgi:enterochelin esterase-like enzyme
VYASGRAADPPAAAVLSPALYRTWADAQARDAFADQATWAAAEPLRHPARLPRLGVWSGEDDPWIAEARQLAAAEHAALARFGPGGHDADYWRRIMPEVLSFLMPPKP